MSRDPYRPLGGHSLSLQPSLTPDGDANSERINLDVDGYGRPSTPTQSRPDTPTPEPMYNTAYDSARYGGAGYTGGNDVYPSVDVEAHGLVKPAKPESTAYRLYKRRWFGLAVLTLHSFAIGWGFTAPTVVSKTAIEWYKISFEELNYLSIAGNLVFLVPAPLVIWVLNRAGPKWSIVISVIFTLVGNWIIYAGAATHSFDVNIAGTIVHSISSAFSLCAPTRYSRQWFGDDGRTFATALPTLAYLLGAGFGALTGPFMVHPVGPLQYDQQALIIAIVFTAVAVPAPFIPSRPSTPPSVVASRQRQLGAKESILTLLRNKQFYLQLITFSILAGAIETTTNVTVQALTPYKFTQQEGANAVSILVFVGIGAALIVSPILDRTKKHELAIKLFTVVIAMAYTALPWIPETHSVGALYAVYAIIGAFSISLEPAVLEHQASGIHPVSPEFASVVTLSGCKVTISILTLLVGKVLVTKNPEEGQPTQSLFNGLILTAALAWLVAICSQLNGHWVFKRPRAAKVHGND